MSDVICPACGSHELEKVVSEQSAQLTLGDEFTYSQENYKCKVCGEEGDFALKNDVVFKTAEKAAASHLVVRIIDDLSNSKVSMARFERAFELPQRTLNRWKSGDFSATALALLRTVRTYPWIVQVAEHGFDQKFVATTVLQQSVQLLEAGITRNVNPEQRSVGVYFWTCDTSTGAVVMTNNATSEPAVAQVTQTGAPTLIAAG